MELQVGTRIHFIGYPEDHGTIIAVSTKETQMVGQGSGFNTGGARGERTDTLEFEVTWDDASTDVYRSSELVPLTQ